MKGITTLSYQYDNPFYFEGNVARVKDHEGFYHLIDRKGKVLTDKNMFLCILSVMDFL